jgi:mono/diheme cytochrome c family protein
MIGGARALAKARQGAPLHVMGRKPLAIRGFRIVCSRERPEPGATEEAVVINFFGRPAGTYVALILAATPFLLLARRGAEPLAASPDPVARGRYLVNAIGCDDCHTPKKPGSHGLEFDFSRRLSGHPEGSALPPAPKLPPGPWAATAAWDLTAWSGPWGVSYAFNLTPDENTGIGSWSEETFVQTIRTGRHMGVARPVLPPMPWQVYRNLSDEDLKAVYAYLRTIPAVKNRVPLPQIVEPEEVAAN